MRVVAIANGYTGALCLQELVDQGDDVVGVVTSPEDPRPGRSDEASVKLTADRNYLPVYQPPVQDLNTPDFVEVIRGLAPDLIVTMHFPIIFGEALLQLPPRGCVNLHPSRLPAGRGMTPSFWHMLVGDDRNWITLFYLDPNIDTGDIIAYGSVEILPGETGFTSSRKLSEEGHRIFAEALPSIREGNAQRVPQSEIEEVEPGYYSWKPHYARIPWEKSAGEIERHIRALSRPRHLRSEGFAWVGSAYTHVAGRRIAAWESEVLDPESWAGSTARPGEIIVVLGEGLLVRTGNNGALLLTDLNQCGARGEGIKPLLELTRTSMPLVFR